MGKWSFEQLEVWKIARKLNVTLGNIFFDPNFKNYSFQDQIMRAALSVQNNIAEWNEWQSNKDFIKFLYYAKKSSGEVRSMLYNALDYWYIKETDFAELLKWYLSLSTKIYNLITYLSKSV